MPRHRIALLAAALAVLAASLPARAELPATCIDQFEKQATQKLDALAAATVKPPADASLQKQEDLGRRMATASANFHNYVEGRWAANCAAVSPDNQVRFDNFKRQKAQPVLSRFGVVWDELCSAYTRGYLSRHTAAVQQAIDDGQAASINREVKALADDLNRQPLLNDCTPMADQRTEVQGKLGGWFKQADLAEATAKVRGYCGSVVDGWYDAQAAFSSKIPAAVPDYVASPDGERNFTIAVKQCIVTTDKLKRLGAYSDQAVLRGSKAPTLGDIIVVARRVDGQLKRFFAKAKAHNATFEKRHRKLWEEQHLKGDGMRTVYTQNQQRIPAEKDLGGIIEWTYRGYTPGALAGECTTYTFSQAGVLKSTGRAACN